jgi:putative thioredoxin
MIGETPDVHLLERSRAYSRTASIGWGLWEGDTEEALDRLIELIPTSGKGRDDLRQVVVGILDELRVDDPLAAASRRRLASALY